jgi:hypothetical protein
VRVALGEKPAQTIVAATSLMGRLIPAGTRMEFYRKIKIPDEVIEGLGEGSKGRPRRKTPAALRVEGQKEQGQFVPGAKGCSNRESSARLAPRPGSTSRAAPGGCRSA